MMWFTAPGYALRTRNPAATEYPTMVHNQACHQLKPAPIIADPMRKLERLTLSAIQKVQ